MITRRTVLLLPLLAAACADDGPAQSFPLPSYSYLTPIRLNVASIEIDDRSAPIGGNSVESLSPLRPADALKQMATDRLSAAGSVGRAVFVIDQASLVRSNGGIDGVMAVHLDVYAGGTTRAGYAEARVVRRRTSTDLDENARAILYDFTTQMMKDMNVEFEFQVRRSLKDWLQQTASGAPLPPPVQSQDLATPGAPVQPMPAYGQPPSMPGQYPSMPSSPPSMLGQPPSVLGAPQPSMLGQPQ